MIDDVGPGASGTERDSACGVASRGEQDSRCEARQCVETPAYLSESAPSDASSVSWARRAVGAFAVAAGMRGQRLEDVRLAVSEAVTNAVAYAYDGGPGEIHVIAAVVSHELWLVVADDGNGMRTRPTETRGLGLGLGLMAQVSDALTIISRSSGGVEVRMRFRLDRHAEPAR